MMDNQDNRIEVGMAEMKISSAPNILITRGLGSCVGIVFYDPIKKIGGLAHPMLPDIDKAKLKHTPSKFVNSVIELMLKELKAQGSIKSTIKVKFFGGGHMFSAIPKDIPFNIGAKNVAMTKEVLNRLKMDASAEDTGGNYGRTIELDLSTGLVKVKTIFHGEKEL